MKKYFNYPDLLIIFYLFLGVYINYNFNQFFPFYLLLSIILLLFSKQEYNYLWLYFTFIIMDTPGYLFFHENEKLGSLFFLSYIHFFSIIVMLKYFISKNKVKFNNYFFSSLGKIYFYYLIFLLLYGIMLGVEGGGKSGSRFVYQYFSVIIFFPLFITIKIMIVDMKQLVNFSKLLFITVITNFIFQLINIYFGKSLHMLLGGNIPLYMDDTTFYKNSFSLIRPIYFMYGNYIASSLSLIFFFQHQKYFSKNFLITVFIISIFVIIFSATRGWIIAISLVILGIVVSDFLIYKKYQFFKIITQTIALFFILTLIYPNISEQLLKTFDRLATISSLFEGDTSAGGTDIRLSTRLTTVIEKFYESPSILIGWGFSTNALKTYDPHVGFASTLLVGGLAGLTIILIFFLNFNRILYNCFFKERRNFFTSNSLLLMIIFSFGLVVISASSTDLLGFFNFIHDGGGKLLFISTFLLISNLIYNNLDQN